MARAKMICIGKTQDGQPCKNWALRGSYYCAQHQSQVTETDRENMKTAESWTTIVLIVVLVLGLIISFSAGCEKGFLHWLSH